MRKTTQVSVRSRNGNDGSIFTPKTLLNFASASNVERTLRRSSRLEQKQKFVKSPALVRKHTSSNVPSNKLSPTMITPRGQIEAILHENSFMQTAVGPPRQLKRRRSSVKLTKSADLSNEQNLLSNSQLQTVDLSNTVNFEEAVEPKLIESATLERISSIKKKRQEVNLTKSADLSDEQNLPSNSQLQMVDLSNTVNFEEEVEPKLIESATLERISSIKKKRKEVNLTKSADLSDEQNLPSNSQLQTVDLSNTVNHEKAVEPELIESATLERISSIKKKRKEVNLQKIINRRSNSEEVLHEKIAQLMKQKSINLVISKSNAIDDKDNAQLVSSEEKQIDLFNSKTSFNQNNFDQSSTNDFQRIIDVEIVQDNPMVDEIKNTETQQILSMSKDHEQNTPLQDTDQHSTNHLHKIEDMETVQNQVADASENTETQERLLTSTNYEHNASPLQDTDQFSDHSLKIEDMDTVQDQSVDASENRKMQHSLTSSDHEQSSLSLVDNELQVDESGNEKNDKTLNSCKNEIVEVELIHEKTMSSSHENEVIADINAANKFQEENELFSQSNKTVSSTPKLQHEISKSHVAITEEVEIVFSSDKNSSTHSNSPLQLSRSFLLDVNMQNTPNNNHNDVENLSDSLTLNKQSAPKASLQKENAVFISGRRKPIMKAPTLRKLNPVKKTLGKKAKRDHFFLPRSQFKGILQHYSSLKFTNEAVDVAEDIFNEFFKKMCYDMEESADKSQRKTLDKSDIKQVMKKQGFVTKERPLHILVEEMFPMEYRRKLIPCAKSVLSEDD